MKKNPFQKGETLIRTLRAELQGRKYVPPRDLFKRLSNTFSNVGRIYETVDYINRNIELFWERGCLAQGKRIALRARKKRKKSWPRESGFYLTSRPNDPNIYYRKIHRGRKGRYLRRKHKKQPKKAVKIVKIVKNNKKFKLKIKKKEAKNGV